MRFCGVDFKGFERAELSNVERDSLIETQKKVESCQATLVCQCSLTYRPEHTAVLLNFSGTIEVLTSIIFRQASAWEKK